MKPNIFSLLIDSLRADKFYGKEKTSYTPNLDSLIKEGVYFTQAITASPASVASISSMFTGKWENVTIRGIKRREFNHTEPNYIKQLNEFGYNTISLTPGYFANAKLTTNFKESPQFNGSLSEGMCQQINDILERLESPYFFFVHILDIHGTAKDFPKQFDEKKYGVNRYERRVSAVDVWLGKFLDRIDRNKTLVIFTADHGTDRGLYTLEQEKLKASLQKKTKVGSLIGKLLPNALNKKLRKMYLDIKTSEKNQRKKSALKNIDDLDPFAKRIQYNIIEPAYTLFDDRYRVPILFAGLELKPKIIEQQIRSVDIFPTLFDIVDLPYKNTIDGKSVLPLMKGIPMKEQPAYLHITTNWAIKTRWDYIDLIGIRYNGFKYFRLRSKSKQSVGLYDLKNDPHEIVNLCQDMPDKVIEMENTLSKIMVGTN